ncbi:MAG: hypothetical protein AB7T49_01965 [Oligoflexales bacterium]
MSANEVLAVDQSVGGRRLAEVDHCVEAILNWALETFGEEQIVKAKEDFFLLTGKVFPEDAYYHARMSYFLDYYVFQRMLESTDPEYRGLTPFQAFSRHQDDCSGSKCGISNFRHSLFRVHRLGSDLTIKDMLTGQKYTVLKRENETFEGMAKKTLFQGFLYINEESSFLSYGLVAHPGDCDKVIQNYLKAAQKAFVDEITILSRLAILHLRFLRHPRIQPKTIYGDGRI